MKKIPVIDITDMYHPHQDVGDNFDILSAFALPEIDLRAVILDITEEFRWEKFEHPIHGKLGDGPREPGIIPMYQCNYLFGRNVPFGIGPLQPLKSQTDTAEDTSLFCDGVDLLLRSLEETKEKVHILSFGSLRVIAAAFNRNPDLMRQKIACIHINAGASGPFLEWNVLLDTHAFVRILRSDLPLAIYPCATVKGPFDIGSYNTFWSLKDSSFIGQMSLPLRRYLTYAFNRSDKVDFLRYLETAPSTQILTELSSSHNVWETAVWMQVAGRELVKTEKGFRYLPIGTATPSLLEELLPCTIDVTDDGLFSFTLTDESTNVRIYHRSTPANMESMLADALGGLYCSYKSRFD